MIICSLASRLDTIETSNEASGPHAELAMHPTVKPVAMVADAIRDCSRRGGVILDAFSGSNDYHCGGADGSAGSRDRTRSTVCRRRDPALAASDRRQGDARRIGQHIR
ncbi:DNA methyltransferase [Sphingopyxis sp. LC363]|uniref:DNA methyltransferase n=1 Tax=Sphingopyxis sp. LC363 TaxID=1120705 RepID=UPI002E109422